MGLKKKILLRNTKTSSLIVCKPKLKMISKEFKSGFNLVQDEAEVGQCLTVGDLNEGKSVINRTIKFGQDEIQEDYPEEIPAQCEFCGKKYKNDKRLKDHISFCHPKVYHKCNICSKQFPKKWILKTHMRNHTGESPYSCSSCGQKFISSSKLRMHSNVHHKQEELHCKMCNAFGFYTKQDLGNHVRTKHTKERPFLCGVCNKSFMSSSVYYQHCNIHANIKKYSCSVCSRSFGRWLTLSNHLRIHRNEWLFSCDVCRLAFRQRGDVKKHKMSQHLYVLPFAY